MASNLSKDSMASIALNVLKNGRGILWEIRPPREPVTVIKSNNVITPIRSVTQMTGAVQPAISPSFEQRLGNTLWQAIKWTPQT
jgi:hypothetical protein